MDKKWKSIIWSVIVIWITLVVSMMIVAVRGYAQVTTGTVNSKTLDGVGNKITSTVVGPSRGFDVNIIAGGGGGPTYLDADGIVNQTASAVHGQTYMYNGATWDRVRGTIAGGLQVNCVTGCSGGSSTPTDAFVNPITAGLSQSFGMVYNGATWDLMRGTVAGGVLVNISNASLAVTGTFFQATQPISAVSLPLPTGAATEATLATRLAEATFTGRFVAATLDADALVNETTTAVHGKCYLYNGASWDRCRGAITTGLLVNVSNATLAVTQSGAWTVAATQSGVWSTGRTWTLSSGTDSVAATVSGTVAVSNAFALDATITNRFPAGSTPADNESNAVTISRIGNFNYVFDGVAWDRWTGAVSQSGTWDIGTVTTLTSITNPVAVTNAGLTNLDVALSTRLAEVTFTGRINTLGQKAMAASTPVVLPSDQSAIPVTVLSTVASANNDGTCPSGAASFTALASNASRTWAAVWASPANTDDVYIKLGATATAADGRFAPGQSLNFTSGRIYTGVIDAFPASGTQAVCVMELN